MMTLTEKQRLRSENLNPRKVERERKRKSLDADERPTKKPSRKKSVKK